jgi:hypothetical protein
MMNTWIGPAIVAAVISSLVTAVGWLVNYRTSLGLEKERRLEKVRDFQIALRAEIRSELHHLNEANLAAYLKTVEEKYAQSKTYSAFTPRLARHAVYESLIGLIYVLPESVIDPIILYARQRELLDQFAADMRTERFERLGQERQLDMCRDYIEASRYLRQLAGDALASIDASLAQKGGANRRA